MTEPIDYLRNAKIAVREAEFGITAQDYAQRAIACALIALVERIDEIESHFLDIVSEDDEALRILTLK